MPGSMDGVGLAQAVRARWPEINVIVVSGQMRPSNPALPLGVGFFGKPYEASALLSAMHPLTGGPKVQTPHRRCPGEPFCSDAT
jgi:YesN/AraC family two-component response regulator